MTQTVPDRATIFQRIQIGVESLAGTAVAALRELASLSIEPSVQVEIDNFRPMGRKFSTLSSLNKEWTEADLSGRVTYTEIIYPLSSLLGRGTAAPGGQTADGTAWTWTFSPRTSRADNPATFTVEQGSDERAHRFSYGIVTEMGVSWSRDGIEISGAMLGRRIEDDITMSGNEVQTLGANANVSAGSFQLASTLGTTTHVPFNAPAGSVQAALDSLLGANNTRVRGGPLPGTAITVSFIGALAYTDVPNFVVAGSASFTGGTLQIAQTTAGTSTQQFNLVPVLPTQVNIYMGTSPAALNSATALSRVLSFDWTMGDRYGPVWTLDARQDSWVAVVETEPSFELTMMLQANAEGMALLPLARSGATRFFRVEAIGGTIPNTTLPYLFRIDTAAQITDVGDFSDEDGTYAIEFTATGVSAPAWSGTATVVTVRNELAAL